MRYIKEKYEAANDAIRYDTIHPYYDAVRSDFDSIQHNTIWCNTMQMEKVLILFTFIASRPVS